MEHSVIIVGQDVQMVHAKVVKQIIAFQLILILQFVANSVAIVAHII